jgi:hypothetical protein
LIILWVRSAHIPSIRAPLLMINGTKDPSNSGIARYEGPKALLSATIAFAHNPGLDYYDGFVIFLVGTSLHISRAMVSAKYKISSSTGLLTTIRYSIVPNHLTFSMLMAAEKALVYNYIS